MSKTAAAITRRSRCRKGGCFSGALPFLPANGPGCSTILRFSIIIPSLPANSMYWPEAHRPADIADCGNSEALIDATPTLASGSGTLIWNLLRDRWFTSLLSDGREQVFCNA